MAEQRPVLSFGPCDFHITLHTSLVSTYKIITTVDITMSNDFNALVNGVKARLKK